MAPPLITGRQLTLNFGEKTIFSGLDFVIQQGEHIGLVGRNGSGKSTFMKMLANFMAPDEGELFLQPGTRIAYLRQEPDFTSFKTINDFVRNGLFADQQDDDYRIDAALAQWNLQGEYNPNQLSGGEKRRAALAQIFACNPDVLLLDEPTNHLDLPTIQDLEKQIKNFRGVVVLISHDRALLQNLTDITLWLDRGVMRRLNKGYTHFPEWSDEVLEQETRERQKLDKLIEQETTWSHQGITARRKRNQGRLRRLYDLRGQRSEMVAQADRAKVQIDTGALSGKMIVEAKGISHSIDGRVLVKDFSTRILRGDRVGIIGANGAGKSTLLQILTGTLKPDTGHVRIGKNLTTVYFDQRRQTLDPEATLWETLASPGTDQVWVRGQNRHVVSYLRDYLFDAGQARSPVKSLSGGEKSRLLLAKLLAQPSNVLILDEPTNDLDMDTLDLLVDVLSEYEGTLIIVSHDRYFLDQLVTSTIVFEDDGQLIEYAGGYSDYKRQAKEKIKIRSSANKPTSKNQPVITNSIVKSLVKLSYKDQRRWEELPKLIEHHQQQLQQLEQQLSHNTHYDADAVHKIGVTYQAVKEQIDNLEIEWLTLEELKSSMVIK